jgi:two-component system response regulator TctD
MKLLLIEDNPAMQTTLQRSFERRGVQVVVCGDGARALDRWRAAVPDVVLLDLSLPGRDGLAVLAAARAEGLDTPVLILTARGTVGDRILGLNTGADDYLAKPFDLDELEARVRALARRVAPARADAAPAADFCGLHADPASGAVYLDGRPMELSGREAALLRALLARPGHAVAKERLSELVFAGEAGVQSDAIEVVAYRLRKKLAATRAQLVTLRGLGYLLKDGS